MILLYKLLVQAFVDLAKLLLHEYSEVNLLSEKFNSILWKSILVDIVLEA